MFGATPHEAFVLTLAIALVLISGASLWAQTAAPQERGGAIRGTVQSGGSLLPGVTVTAANTLTGEKAITSTDVNGGYALRVLANGRYVVRAQMAAFAALTHEVVVNESNRAAQADFELILSSRAVEIEQKEQKQAAASTASHGFQSLSLTQGEGSSNGAEGGANASSDANGFDASVAGMNASAATESVSYHRATVPQPSRT